jgi:hypothetical protein
MDKNHKTCLALVRVAHSSHKATKRSNFSFSLWLRVLSDWKERARDRFRGLFVQDFARHEPSVLGIERFSWFATTCSHLFSLRYTS